eukprot:SAG22_NODE_2574_length_2425_cov_2.925623_4_plen_139_part_00
MRSPLPCADDSYVEHPAGATVLHARDLPPSGGGDTLFLDMAAAYEALAATAPAEVQSLQGLCAVHAYNNKGAFKPRPSAAGGNDVLLQPRHPILRRQPITGATALYWDLDRYAGGSIRAAVRNTVPGRQLCSMLRSPA